MKKRVLQFIGSFHQGGSERQAVGLTRLLKNEGSFEVFAATLNRHGVLRVEIEKIGLREIPEFPLKSFYDPNFVGQVRRCAKYLRENKIDLVHTHDFYTNVFGMAAATLAGVGVRIASKRETSGMRSGPQRLVEKIAFGRAKVIVANSNAVRDHLIARGITAGKISVIYNGIDHTRFDTGAGGDTVRERFGLPRDAKLITLVANLRHEVKNVPMVLRSAKRVVAEHPETHFVIAGEGELRHELEGLAVRLGVARNVHFIGRCDEVPSLLSDSYACVLTSSAEGFSNSMLEYMAAGKPVVATDVGGAAEAVTEGDSGYLVASDDDAAMAERLVELLNDPGKAAAFGTAGKRAVAEKFSEEIQLRKTIELDNSCLARA